MSTEAPSVSTETTNLRLYREPTSDIATPAMRVVLWSSFIALMLVPVVTLVDLPIARWFASDPLATEVGKAVQLSEVYSHGIGVLFTVVAILTIAPQHRWCMPRLITMALGASAIATVVKMFVLRPRPSQINLNLASNDAAWLWSFDWTLDHVAAFDAGTRAFPSGDVATAIALTLALSMLIPRGRYLFVTFAIMTMMQRMQSGAHFFSDVIGGMGLGLFWCYICLHPRLLGALFQHMEPTQRRRKKTTEEPIQQAA
ncbi:PAP2 superfamily protein [Roseimaritima multifibrata]|uniref:PAP2 superfamily protein n=1 Tax=Roseimaritima multifibrata TaxID=1930274 RepID=A0A517MAI2_9BACT|nr:phosphatase PAP2 family protein [Roseimaritima multifibrata]QDS91787.1 PAP2 superfamily protein [Roseimaritima multifibrata]